MAKGDQVPVEEEVVRAFFIPHWDEVSKRATPSAFLDRNGVSVSRLAVLSYQEIVEIYKANFDGQKLSNGQVRYVRQTGRLSVARIHQLCDQKIDSQPPQDPPLVCAKVTEDPTDEIPQKRSDKSHALIEGWDRATKTIRKEFSRTVAKRLLDECVKQDVE